MAKINRNAPCPCGSGQKYKRCCLPRDQQAAARSRDAAAPETPPWLPPAGIFDVDDIDRLSNSVLDFIDQGRLDEAEHACRQLQREFPEAIDWIERTGALHEARGDTDKAIEYYRRCLQYIDDHAEGFEEASKDWYRRSITRLEARDHTPGASAPQR